MQIDRSTFIALPADVSDSETLKIFLQTLIEKLDVIFGHRGDKVIAQTGDVISVASSLNSLVKDFNVLGTKYLARDGSVTITGDIQMDENVIPNNVNSIVNKQYVDTKVESIPTYEKQEAPNILQEGATLTDVIATVNILITRLKASGILI